MKHVIWLALLCACGGDAASQKTALMAEESQGDDKSANADDPGSEATPDAGAELPGDDGIGMTDTPELETCDDGDGDPCTVGVVGELGACWSVSTHALIRGVQGGHIYSVPSVPAQVWLWSRQAFPLAGFQLCFALITHGQTETLCVPLEGELPAKAYALTEAFKLGQETSIQQVWLEFENTVCDGVMAYQPGTNAEFAASLDRILAAGEWADRNLPMHTDGEQKSVCAPASENESGPDWAGCKLCPAGAEAGWELYQECP